MSLITKATLTGTYWVLVGDGTRWRDAVQATEMWRVTLKVKWQAGRSDGTLNRHAHIHTLNSSSHKGEFRALTHRESHVDLRDYKAHKYVLAHSLTGSESGLCFKDETDSSLGKTGEFWRVLTLLCSTLCRKTWVNTMVLRREVVYHVLETNHFIGVKRSCAWSF